MASKYEKYGSYPRPILYNIWCNMKTRCYNPSTKSFKNYGGRGIKVCSKWKDSYKLFEDDMLPSYSNGLTLERINVNGNYEPSNCTWKTRQEQSLNTTRTHRIVHEGKSLTVSEWSKLSGLKLSTFRQRFYVYGWSLEKCLTVPLMKQKRG